MNNNDDDDKISRDEIILPSKASFPTHYPPTNCCKEHHFQIKNGLLFLPALSIQLKVTAKPCFTQLLVFFTGK